jgi:hypothetical protein
MRPPSFGGKIDAATWRQTPPIVLRYIRFLEDAVDSDQYWGFIPWIEQQLRTFSGDSREIRSFLKHTHQNLLRLVADFELRLKTKPNGRKSWRIPKWIEEDPEILSRIKETKFLNIFQYALERVVPDSPAEKICSNDRLQDGTTGKRFAIFIPDYSFMEQELKVKQPLIKKYLAAFCHYGIFKKLGKVGPRGNMVYAVGYYPVSRKAEHKVIHRPISFLRRTPEMIENLRKFKVQQTHK